MRIATAIERAATYGLAGSIFALAFVGGCKEPAGGGNAGGGNGASSSATNVDGISQAKAYEGDTIVLGEYASLTGSTATFGKSSDAGTKMAIDEINNGPDKGVLGKKIEVLVENDDSKPEQAATAVKKLINQSNVLAVLGEVASSRSLAAAPICQKAGVPMISPSSTNPKVTQVGDYIFRTCFIDPFQGTVCARFAKNDLKAKSAAILTDVANDYSKGLTEFFTAEFLKNGGKIVKTESYSENDKDFRAQLTSIKGAKPDVIFVPGYYTEVGNIAVQARTLGMKQPLLGGDGWDSENLHKIGGADIDGSYFSNHYSPSSKDPRVVKFVSAYRKRYGAVPDALAAVAYDAAYIMVDAIKRAGSTDRAKIRDAIAATKNYPGVTGNITIDPERNAIKPLVILQVQGADYKYITTVNP